MKIKIFKFAIVGIINNILNYSVVFFVNQIIGLNAFLSAAFGFLSGASISFLLNSKYTFKFNFIRRNTIILFLSTQFFILIIFSGLTSFLKLITNSISYSWLIATLIIFSLNYFLQSKFVFRR